MSILNKVCVQVIVLYQWMYSSGQCSVDVHSWSIQSYGCVDKGGAFCRNETLASERLRVQPLADQSMVGFKSTVGEVKGFPI